MGISTNFQIKNERDCGLIEFWLRRAYSGLLYWRLYRYLYPENPYYTPSLTKKLDKILNGKDKIVFEYGSGVSTVWYGKRATQVYSIEHSELWFNRVSDLLNKNQLLNVSISYIPPENKQFTNYSKAILDFDNETFDLVAVDGRDRLECVSNALNKVKIGGYLILDDSHRPRYQNAFEMLSNYSFQRYDFGLLQTTLFQRVA